MAWLGTAFLLLVSLVFGAARTYAADAEAGPIPPRLSLIKGDVSFWRPGEAEWTAALVNTALAPGDMLSTGAGSWLELQVGGHAFVRADANTDLALDNQTSDFIRLRVGAGRVTVDLPRLGMEHRIEVDTPNAAFTLDRDGYYRVLVQQDKTSFVTRRGGHAVVTVAKGQVEEIDSDEQVLIEGKATVQLARYKAPDADSWDRWNFDRTDDLLRAESERYVPADMYGVDDLDDYGSWRVVPTYGRVWVPASVPPAWAPYSVGRWLWDPYYGWTWVDAEPWGWAPFHYGRWVYADPYWAWAPGPLAFAVSPVYAPALVAFFHGSHVSVAVGTPFVSWVALGWGEPLFPWWGPSWFIGHPWWAGWCGPRHHHDHHDGHDNDHHDGHDNGHNDHHGQHTNANVPNAVVTSRSDRFGHREGKYGRLALGAAEQMRPVQGALPVQPIASGGRRPPGPGPRPLDTAAVTAGRSTKVMRQRERAAAGVPAAAPPERHTQATAPRSTRRERLGTSTSASGSASTQRAEAPPRPRETTRQQSGSYSVVRPSRVERLQERSQTSPPPQRVEVPPPAPAADAAPAPRAADAPAWRAGRAERLREYSPATRGGSMAVNPAAPAFRSMGDPAGQIRARKSARATSSQRTGSR